MKLKILFIGNSHTYLHYMPQMLVQLGKAGGSGVDLEVNQSVGEGASLGWHWNHGATRQKIRSRNWDYIVLQDRSGGPLEDLKSFQECAVLLDAEIKRRRSKTVFYQTWANRNRPESQTRLTDAYQGVADDLEAILAPVGQAWVRAQDLYPEIGLYHKDGRHASPVGAYLTACVFYSVVLDSSPEGLPASFFLEGKMRPQQDPVQARQLQKVAWQTILNLKAGSVSALRANPRQDVEVGKKDRSED